MLKEKKIPTILGLFILIGAIFAGAVFTNKNTNFISKASGDCQPINPQVTNITNNSASISFVTESFCLSSLLINNQTISNSAVLSNDQKSKIHYFDVNNLDNSIKYDYSFINDGKTYKSSTYQFETASNPNGSIPSSNLAWGRVFTPELKAASKVMVFINIPNASPLSALVTTSGNWNISLANSFNESKTNRFTPTDNTSEEIIVIDQEKQTTQINANTSQNDPTPDIILGQNQFSSLPVTFDAATNTGSLSSVTPVPNSKELDILNPKDSESISTQKPDFFGTGPSKATIKIEIHSPTVYTGEVTVNDDGSWNWSPPADLSPGEHTITVTVKDNGIDKIISKKFTILAADNSLSYSASPSASSTVTPIVTIAPTVATTPVVTAIPTAIITPAKTATITSVPTVRTSKPSTSSGIPTTGNLAPTIILLLISSSFITFSLFSFRKK
ncbi:MAG: Ig-like domain-containing protein [Candidatus Shapirobacteria bacterium]|nr:Ig-like domain-containing protein [Candidatus Shapirobacteria bacterium]MDD4410785.1 Ig-like domain-containing protein [Candidatus Shapirobacteria bacterium]